MVTYIITNLINSKCYVGITVNTHKRWLDHRHGRGSKLLYRAFNKYGIENFLFEVIFNGTYQEVKDKEIELIEELSAMVPYGYNLTLGGEGPLVMYLLRRLEENYQKHQQDGLFQKRHEEN